MIRSSFGINSVGRKDIFFRTFSYAAPVSLTEVGVVTGWMHHDAHGSKDSINHLRLGKNLE